MAWNLPSGGGGTTYPQVPAGRTVVAPVVSDWTRFPAVNQTLAAAPTFAAELSSGAGWIALSHALAAAHPGAGDAVYESAVCGTAGTILLEDSSVGNASGGAHVAFAAFGNSDAEFVAVIPLPTVSAGTHLVRLYDNPLTTVDGFADTYRRCPKLGPWWHASAIGIWASATGLGEPGVSGDWSEVLSAADLASWVGTVSGVGVLLISNESPAFAACSILSAE